MRLGRPSSTTSSPTLASVLSNGSRTIDDFHLCCKALVSARQCQCLNVHTLVYTILTSLKANSRRSRIVVHELDGRRWSAYVVGARVWQTMSEVVYTRRSLSVRTVFKYIIPPQCAPSRKKSPLRSSIHLLSFHATQPSKQPATYFLRLSQALMRHSTRVPPCSSFSRYWPEHRCCGC